MGCCWWYHRFTRWAPCLIEYDPDHTLIVIGDVEWRMCVRCGYQEERDLSCVSS